MRAKKITAKALKQSSGSRGATLRVDRHTLSSYIKKHLSD